MRPIEKEIVVDCGVERAFQLFTTRVDAWWPPSHRRGVGQMRLDAFVGGRLSERGDGAEERVFGEVLVWEPPERLVLSWWPGSAPGAPTRAEIHFEALGERTRVRVTHTDGGQPVAEGMEARFVSGWEAVLAAFDAHTREGA